MRYKGGVARFDNQVKFGHEAAQAQQDFGGRPLTEGRSGIPAWLIVAVGGVAAVIALIALIVLLRRRRAAGRWAARRALDGAVARAATARQPLSLVRIADSSGDMRARKLAAVVRPRLRPADRSYRLGKAELLILMPATRSDAARAVCSDLQAPLSQAAGPDRVEITVVEANGLRSEILLERLREARVPMDEVELSPEMIHRWTSASKDEPPS
jgi:nucleotide-binding universal stress UspA family protein